MRDLDEGSPKLFQLKGRIVCVCLRFACGMRYLAEEMLSRRCRPGESRERVVLIGGGAGEYPCSGHRSTPVWVRGGAARF